MQKCFLLILSLFLFSNCAQLNKSVIKENREESNQTEFGPFFWPESSNLSSVSIHYFTKQPEETDVYFCMAGELDWIRKDTTLTRNHKMIFEDLEESTSYKFSIRNKSDQICKLSSIKTIPYGKDYQFNFAIAPIDENLNNTLLPYFLILNSKKNELKDSEFLEYYFKNKEILASTIILPLFSFTINNKKYTLSENGIYCLRYKNLSLILIHKDIKDYDSIIRYLSTNPDDKNMIILGAVEDKTSTEIINRYSTLVDKIYVNKNYSGVYKNVLSINKTEVINFVQKAKYAAINN